MSDQGMWPTMDVWQNFQGFPNASGPGLTGEVKVEKQDNMEVSLSYPCFFPWHLVTSVTFNLTGRIKGSKR